MPRPPPWLQAGAAVMCHLNKRRNRKYGRAWRSANTKKAAAARWAVKLGYDPVLTLAFNVLFLLLVPLFIGLASSTALRATFWSAFAVYLYPALTFSWEMINRIRPTPGPQSGHSS